MIQSCIKDYIVEIICIFIVLSKIDQNWRNPKIFNLYSGHLSEEKKTILYHNY